jgi:hypothetical protein
MVTDKRHTSSVDSGLAHRESAEELPDDLFARPAECEHAVGLRDVQQIAVLVELLEQHAG